MARSNSKRRRRDNITIANRRLPTRSRPNHLRSVSPSHLDLETGLYPKRGYVTEAPRRRDHLRLVEDRRYFHPMGPARPASAFTRSSSRVVVPKWSTVGAAGVTAKLAFNSPSSVLVCVRRKSRREVLFAKGKGGRRGQRRPKRNIWSSIKCRR